MRTTFDTLCTLALHTIDHLTQEGMVEYSVDKRASLIDALATELAVSFSTDEDIRDQAMMLLKRKCITMLEKKSSKVFKVRIFQVYT